MYDAFFPLNSQSQQLLSALSSAFKSHMILKVVFANRMDPDQGPHCLPICINRFEKFARIFSRRHKQMTFSDAGFLGVLRVRLNRLSPHNILEKSNFSFRYRMSG